MHVKQSQTEDDGISGWRRIYSTPSCAASTAGAVGALVLVGWVLDIDFLRRMVPGLVAMNPATAVAFMLAGLSLWLLRDEPASNAISTTRRLGHVCAVIVLGTGFLKLIEIVVGWETGIDRWLFSNKLAVAGSAGLPNRMAPNTALNFCLAGGALLLLDIKTRRAAYFAQFLALAIVLSSLLALIGYAFNNGTFYRIATFIPMALHTALAFLTIALGILVARPNQGPVAIFTSRGQGGIVARRLVPSAILVPIVLGWLRLEGERAGLYEMEVGVALMATMIIFVFTGLIASTAGALERADKERQQAEVERRQAEEGFKWLQRQYSLIINSISDGIFVINSTGHILFENPAALKMLGWEAHELDGKLAHATIHHTRRDGTPYPVNECPIYATLEKTAVTCPMDNEVFWRKDGTSLAVEYTSTPLQDKQGEINGVVVSFRDIAQRKQSEEALRQAKEEAERARQEAERARQEAERARQEAENAREEAERANAAKSEFLSRMSHELRTPLNAILGFGQLLEMDGLNAKQLHRVGHILKGGGLLLDLINEVLDIAGIESGRVTLSAEPVELGQVVQEMLTLVQPMAAIRHISLINEVGVCYVMADLQRLKQVLLNLLSNAVKYNREGGRVLLSHAAAEGRVRIYITDNGPGISPAGLEKLFMPFERLDAAQKGVEGTGIGLTICQRLVQLMGGEIGVRSVEGEGSTFQVELPGAQDPMDAVESREGAGPAVEKTSAEIATQDVVAHTLLYIEDNLSNLDLIEHILARRAGFRLLSAMQGRRGLELALDHCPDLILLDLHLPDIPGDEVLRHLRAEPATRNIPVVMLSADATPRQIERLLQAGAKAYLTKPLNVKQFMAVLDENLVIEDAPRASPA